LDQIHAEITGKLSDAQVQVSVQSADFSAHSTGRFQWLDSKQTYNAQSFQIDGAAFGTWQLQAPMQLRIHDGSYQFSPFCLGSTDHSARTCALDTGTTIAIEGHDFPLFLLEPWLNNAGKEFTYIGIANLDGELSKDLSLAGTGFINIQVPSLKIGIKASTGTEVTHIDDIQLGIKWLNQRIGAKVRANLQQNGYIAGELNTGFSANAPLVGKLRVEMFNLDWLELFSLDIAQPKGQIHGEIEVSGTRAAPLINGSYVLKSFSVQIPALGLKLNDGQLTATSNDNTALLIKGSIKSGESRMQITGLWDPADQLSQPINIRMIGKNIALADTPNLQLTADTDLLLTYETGIYALQGDIHLTKGFVNLEAFNSEIAISNDVLVLDPAPETVNRDTLRLALRLNVSANEQVRVKGFGLDGIVAGNVLVNSPYDSPTRLIGTLKLVGKYEAFGQELQIKHGNLTYTNSLITAPRLDILTERFIEDENITVGLEVTGSASNPKTRVISNPTMTDSEALSWLLFGRALHLVNANQAQTINAKSMALNAGGSLLLGSVGKQIGLDHASLSDSRVLGDSTLTIGKQLSPRLFVSYGVSLLGIGQVITLKYLLKQGLDISIESEQSNRHEQTSAALNWRK
jgi:translocation and assembly module TamB